MALTVAEASAVHALLGWLFARPNGAGEFTSGDGACEAAVFLAERAHKTLMCGPGAADVRAAWAELDLTGAVDG